MNMKNIYLRTFLPCRYFVVITGNMSVNASITPLRIKQESIHAFFAKCKTQQRFIGMIQITFVTVSSF